MLTIEESIDWDEVEAAIDIVEEGGPCHSFGELCRTTSELLEGDISPKQIKDYIQQSHLPVKTKTKEPLEDFTRRKVARIHVVIPSGPCPVPLRGSDLDTVEKWVHDMRIHGLENHNHYYAPEALVYFARTYYSPSEPQFVKIKQLIEHVCADS